MTVFLYVLYMWICHFHRPSVLRILYFIPEIFFNNNHAIMIIIDEYFWKIYNHFCIFMYKSMTTISERQPCMSLYIQKQKNCETFIYIKNHTLSKKQDNLRKVLFTKSHILYGTRFFMKFLKLAFIHIQKSMTLCVTWRLLLKNPDTSKKTRQFGLRFFIYKKPDTLRYAIFHRFFEFGGGGRHFY